MKMKITIKTGKFSYFPAPFAFHPLSFRLPSVRKLSTLSMLSLFHRYNRNSLIRWNEFSGFSWWSIDPWLENFHCSSEIFFFLFFSLFFFFLLSMLSSLEFGNGESKLETFSRNRWKQYRFVRIFHVYTRPVLTCSVTHNGRLAPLFHSSLLFNVSWKICVPRAWTTTLNKSQFPALSNNGGTERIISLPTTLSFPRNLFSPLPLKLISPLPIYSRVLV